MEILRRNPILCGIAILFYSLMSLGCISPPEITPRQDVEVGSLYDINPGTVGMKTDVKATVTIPNTWNRDFELTIENALIVPEGESPIYGEATPSTLFIPEGEERSLEVVFIGVPVKYQVESSPLRLRPLISSYTVVVNYVGKAKVAWIIPVSDAGKYEKTIYISEVPLDEEMLKSDLGF